MVPEYKLPVYDAPKNLTVEQMKEQMRQFFPHFKRWKKMVISLLLPVLFVLNSVNSYALSGSWRGDLNLGLIGELSAEVNHLLHRHVLRELAVFVAVNAVILIGCAICIRAEYFI